MRRAEGKHAFLVDHNIDGRVLMPATSYVCTAWEAAATRAGKEVRQRSSFSHSSHLGCVEETPPPPCSLSVPAHAAMPLDALRIATFKRQKFLQVKAFPMEIQDVLIRINPTPIRPKP